MSLMTSHVGDVVVKTLVDVGGVLYLAINAILPVRLLFQTIFVHTLQSLYNAARYNTVLVITQPGLGSQMVIFL